MKRSERHRYLDAVNEYTGKSFKCNSVDLSHLWGVMTSDLIFITDDRRDSPSHNVKFWFNMKGELIFYYRTASLYQPIDLHYTKFFLKIFSQYLIPEENEILTYVCRYARLDDRGICSITQMSPKTIPNLDDLWRRALERVGVGKFYLIGNTSCTEPTRWHMVGHT